MARRQPMSRARQGGWSWMDWANLAMDVYGAASANSAAKGAKKQAGAATAAQDRALDANTAISLSSEGRSAEAWDTYMDDFLPAKQDAVRLARKPINPNLDAAQAGADFSLADSVRGGTMRRNLTRAGVDPSSGASVEAERLNLIDSTAGKVAAMGKSRRNAGDRYIDRLLRTADSGQGLIGASTTYSQAAATENNQLSGAYGARANAATAAAGAAGEQFGESVTDVLGGLSDMWKSRKPAEQKPGIMV